MRLQPLTGHNGLLTMTALTCLATTVACGGGGSPELTGLTDQVAQVGTELKVDLNATDPDGDQLSYTFRAPDLTDLDGHAQVSVSPSGAGVFRWTPLAADVGEHAFDFTVSDGGNDTTVTINIDVKSAIGQATAPVFRQPLGTGTTIDLSRKKCVDLEVVIEDQDTAQIELEQEEPIIEGAELTQNDGLTGKWHWCPSRAQESEDRYTLVLSADDGDNPKTVKNYLVVLRSGSGTSCPGTAPTISHTPMNASTIVGLTVDGLFTDDKGLKDAPLFYYSTTQPGATPDLSTMTQLSTIKISGTNTNGHYAADVPNPVAGMPSGTTRTLYYLFVADDDDDEMGNCDHSTTSQVYSMTVTSTGQANLPICATCTTDAQCGTGDECVYMGSMGASYCLQACGSGCPSGYSCSAADVYSVDFNAAPQCVPQSGSCEMPTGACADDTWEENDTRTQASTNPTLVAGNLYDVVSCPSTTGANTDDDWYKLVVTTEGRVDIQMAGDAATDLDLRLYNSDGTIVSASTSFNPDEEIIKCLKPKTYYVKVNGIGHARNPYLFSYDITTATCDTTCVDDAREDDDTYSQARTTTYPTYSSTANKICGGDDDWYKVMLYSAEVMTVDLTFTQNNATEDLDIHLYRNSIDTTPCDVGNSSGCTSVRGQGASSNEHTTFTAPAGCDSGCEYDVVVHGYNGSTNTYGIAIGIQ
jgi:hypothetical protein